MAHSMAAKYSLIFIITIIIGLISAQNITEPNTTLPINETTTPTSTSTTTTTTSTPPTSPPTTTTTTSTTTTPSTTTSTTTTSTSTTTTPQPIALNISSTTLPSTKNDVLTFDDDEVSENSTNNNNKTHSNIIEETKLLQEILPSSEKPPDTSTSTELVQPQFPPDCSYRRRNRHQPIETETSRIRKCCPKGESLVPDEDNLVCQPSRKVFAPKVIAVELYDGCIEDLEEVVTLGIVVELPCKGGLLYSPSYDDHLAVVQDGSLLTMTNTSYQIHANYCLDTNIETGDLYAIVCETEDKLNHAQTILFNCFMIFSIACLCVVSFLHFFIKELRSVHGLSLGVMTACMAIGFILHLFTQVSDLGKSWIGFAIQFFIMAYYFWLFCLCCNVVMHICYYLPNKVIINRSIRYCHFNTYCLIAFSFPFGFVLWTNYKELPGVPSFFFHGVSDAVRESQRYFIPPVSVVLILSLLLLIISFFGYKYLDKINFRYATYQQVTVYTQTTLPIHIYDQESYQEIRKDTKCICYLYAITILTWTLEVLRFYLPGPSQFMEVMNALQGAFILMIFVVVRRRRNAIVRWWHGRSPHGLTAVPMKDLVPIENRPPPETS